MERVQGEFPEQTQRLQPDCRQWVSVVASGHAAVDRRIDIVGDAADMSVSEEHLDATRMSAVEFTFIRINPIWSQCCNSQHSSGRVFAIDMKSQPC